MTDYAQWLAPALIIVSVAGLALWAWLTPDEDPNRWPGIE